jgi:hypothetical protein
MKKRELVPWDGDLLTDIGTLDMDFFWERCEELLPDDWTMQLAMKELDGHRLYLAFAMLDDRELENPPIRSSEAYCSSPVRALERLYYYLRDSLVAYPETASRRPDEDPQA